ncbi:MAG: SRPBCC domain-containing protein [Candidatus Thorarchaeota archaeon]
MMTDSLGVEIKQATLIRASPERVYDAIATAEGLDSWFTSGSVVDARPGGRIQFVWKDWGPDKYTTESDGPVLEAERGKRFVFQWNPDSGNRELATTIEISLEAVKEGTILRLREYGHENTSTSLAALAECAAGWGEAITLMKFYVEHGIIY